MKGARWDQLEATAAERWWWLGQGRAGGGSGKCPQYLVSNSLHPTIKIDNGWVDGYVKGN